MREKVRNRDPLLIIRHGRSTFPVPAWWLTARTLPPVAFGDRLVVVTSVLYQHLADRKATRFLPSVPRLRAVTGSFRASTSRRPGSVSGDTRLRKIVELQFPLRKHPY